MTIEILIAILTFIFFLMFGLATICISIFGGVFWLVRKLQKNKEDLSIELQKNKVEFTKELHNLGDKIKADYVQHITCNERRDSCPCIKDIDNLKEKINK